jgi:HEAT repeat protein
MPRLKGRNWYLTKYTRTFQPGEMRDLEFQPAIPVLAKTISQPSGAQAAGVLSQLGTNAVTVLIAACRSTNSNERIHASAALQSIKDPRVAELLPALFKDDLPQVRYHAVYAAAPNWQPRFADPLIALFRDPYPQIAVQAAQWLTLHESPDRTPVYVELLRDRDPTVQNCALRVLQRMNRPAIPRADLLRLLGNPQLATVSLALNILQQEDAPLRPEVLPGGAGFMSRTQKNWLSSTEAAPLTTNSLTMARLMSLKILVHNADPAAIELGLPLLRDTNSVVRSRAFAFLRSVSGQKLPQNDPEQWEQWWAANRNTFQSR